MVAPKTTLNPNLKLYLKPKLNLNLNPPGWKVLLRDLHKRRKPNINIARESIKMKL